MATVTETQPYSKIQPSMWENVKQGVRASGLPWAFIAPSIIVMLFITFLPQAYQIVRFVSRLQGAKISAVRRRRSSVLITFAGC